MISITETIEVAFQSIFRNKLRALLTMLGIIIGVGSVILLISIGAGLKKYVSDIFADMGSNTIYVTQDNGQSGPPMGNGIFTERDVRNVRRIGYPVKDATGLMAGYVKLKYRGVEENTSYNGTDEIGLEIMNYKAEKGRGITQEDVDKKARVAFLGPSIAEKLFGQASPVGKNILIQSTKYKVIGIFESKGGGGIGQSPDDEIFLPYTTAMQQFNTDKFILIYIDTKNKEDIEDAKDAVKEELIKVYDEDEITIQGQEELLDTINDVLSALTAGLGGIAAISLLVGGIGIMNIMFVTVTERTKEVGLRKAVGAKPNDILFQFLIESIVLSVLGGTIGILFAMGVSAIISQFIQSTVTIGAIGLAFGFSSFIGIIFGVVPAYKAAKLDPIKALKYE